MPPPRLHTEQELSWRLLVVIQVRREQCPQGRSCSECCNDCCSRGLTLSVVSPPTWSPSYGLSRASSRELINARSSLHSTSAAPIITTVYCQGDDRGGDLDRHEDGD
jgi:hypothetical protein